MVKQRAPVSLPLCSSPLPFPLCRHLPITDMNGATVPDDELKAFLLELIAYLKAGEFLYIQDSEGNGKSGTICAVLLGLVYRLSSSEALDLAQRSRGDRVGAHGFSPETHEQKMQVHRLLGDDSFRAAAAAAAPRHPDSAAASENDKFTAALSKVREPLVKKGRTSLIYLKRYAVGLAGASQRLSWAQLQKLSTDAEWFATPEELLLLWTAVSTGTASSNPAAMPHASASIDVQALFRLLRGNMSPRRSASVHEVFRKLSGGTGFVSLDKLAAALKPETHPDVKSGKRTAEDIKAEFYDTFGIGVRGESSQRQVSAEEFESYYAHISCTVQDDALFDMIVFGSWPQSSAGAIARAATTAAKEAPWKTHSESVLAASAAAAAAAGGGPAAGAESVLTLAYLKSKAGRVAAGAGGAAAGGMEGAGAASLNTTEHGYAFVDLTSVIQVIPALQAYLGSRAEMACALLGATLRRHEASVKLDEVRAGEKEGGKG